MRLFSDGEPRRNVFPNKFVQLLKIDMRFAKPRRFHAATNIDAHQVRADLIMDRHGRADGTTGAGVDIRHHADTAILCIRLVQQLNHLADCLVVRSIREDFCRCIFSLKLEHISPPKLNFYTANEQQIDANQSIKRAKDAIQI